MAHEPLRHFLQQLRQSVGLNGARELADPQLLERYAAAGDGAAFEVLVWRHGAMVLDVCRCLLQQTQDVEDAFQATFLVLVRRARSIRKQQSLASWLYKVAYRVALRARRTRERRNVNQQELILPQAEAGDGHAGLELRPVLDEELKHLPEKYRVPVVLCYLQGLTTAEAAAQIGCPQGTIHSRLSWARGQLRSRLVRRGLAISAAGLASFLTAGAAATAVPARLVASVLRNTPLATSARTVSASPSVSALTEGVLQTMFLAKARLTAAALLVLSALGLGIGLAGQPALAEKPAALVAGKPDTIQLPPEALPRLGVEVGVVKARGDSRPRVLRLPGTLTWDNLIQVRTRFAGEIVAIGQIKDKDVTRPLRIGDKVRKGDLLAVVSSKELGLRQIEFMHALWNELLTGRQLERCKKLFEDGALPSTVMKRTEIEHKRNQLAARSAELSLKQWLESGDEIETLRQQAATSREKPGKDNDKNLGRVALRAPRDGIVVEKNVHVGDLATVNDTLFIIADPGRLQVLAHASIQDRDALTALSPEERVWSIRPVGAPDAKPVKGRIVDIDGKISPHLLIKKIDRLIEDMWDADGKKLLMRIDPEVRYSLFLERYLKMLRGSEHQEMSASVTGWVDNGGGLLQAGKLVIASVELPPSPREAAVPASALVEEGGQTYVLVQPDPAKFQYTLRSVLVVRRGRNTVHLRSHFTADETKRGYRPLRPGERIVTGGAVELKGLLEDARGR